MRMSPGFLLNKSEALLSFFFFLFLGLVVFIRVMVYLHLDLVYIDSDQPLLWAGASDYAKGLFYEPRFYGQAYNTLMESLFAVPFLWFGMPVYYAVPLATQFIFLFPWLFSAIYLYVKKQRVNALLVLSVLLCLPNSYDLLCGLPRGFVTGLFFTAFYVITLLSPKQLSFIALNTVMAVLGYFVNPNSALVSGPFLLYVFLVNFRNRKYLVVSFLCLLSYFPFSFLFDRFYIVHPDRVVHKIDFEFATGYLYQNISSLDKRFGHIALFTEYNCIPLFLVLFALLVYLFRQNKNAFISLLGLFPLLLFSFCLAETCDGSTWIYFSYSRMYLGIPVTIALFLCVRKIEIKGAYKLLFFIPVIYTFLKFDNYTEMVKENAKENHWEAVNVTTLGSALHVIKHFKDICRSHQVNALFISGKFWIGTTLAYGGPATDATYPKAILTNGERRYWEREANIDSVYTSFVFLSPLADFDKIVSPACRFEVKKIDYYGTLLVTHNHLKKAEFIRYANALERLNGY